MSPMDQASLYATEANCTQEYMPKCQVHCPLHMDVRTFMAHMADGKLAEARKLIDRHLPLPNIFVHICDHPCQNHCLRKDFGGSLAIQSLESLCMLKTNKQGKGFMRPPKAKKVAILGNGLCGLVVAYELAKKSWPVTIFYAQEDNGIEDFICKQFPNLSLEQVQDECNQLAKQHAKFLPIKLGSDCLNNLNDEFDAIFIDAHAAAEVFTALNTKPDALTFHIKDNICAAGELCQSPTGHAYASPATQAGQGRQASLSIERILGGIAPDAGRGDQESTKQLHTPLDGLENVQAIIPKNDSFQEDEAKAEAARCIQCQCMQCVKKCLYLQKYGSFPRSYARQIYNNAAIVQGDRRANSLVNGCMMCGQCTEICPERFSMAELCLRAREDLVTRKHMPPSAHEFALEDMLSATSAQATLFMKALSKDNTPATSTKYALFPGCQLTSIRGSQVLKVFDFLHEHLEDGVGLMLSCCGIGAKWAGQRALATKVATNIEKQWEKMGKPTLIMACASCKKFFTDELAHIPTTSLWEVLYTLRQHIPASQAELTCTLHDPCAARLDQGWQEATRLLAEHCGVKCHEAVNNKNTTSCCGYGGLVWCSQPELAQAVTKQLSHDLGSHMGLTSCIMCKDRLIKSDKDCIHFFDILPLTAQDGIYKNSPSLSARRSNRIRLVQEITQNYGNATFLEPLEPLESVEKSTLDPIQGHTFLRIDENLLAQLEGKHILHQDAAAAVLAVEKHGQRILEKESGHYVGAWHAGLVTFWVRYTKDSEGNGYQLHDAWSHRMFMPNTDPNAPPYVRQA